MNEHGSENNYPQGGFSPLPDAGEATPQKTQSKLGIASFIIGLISIICFIVAIILATSFIMDHNFANSNSLQQEIEANMQDIEAFAPIIGAGLLIIGSMGASIVGLILGIVGACAKHKRKAFSIIGIVLNAMLPVGFFGLFLLGLTMGG
ncbi:hypothetical protein [Paenibacillus montanisoli]|uniref:DUF4064 domain-containing protein n=1 Tax=Paenibacillus montanisoli TaxID=2081970 RepID=A0A328TYA0_9BACL|nr:hypothetical protein [Paenibacillus montanisoli]RAP75468.1 hypothetical protein DL346_19175 [Paenibacillus montanisoli]